MKNYNTYSQTQKIAGYVQTYNGGYNLGHVLKDLPKCKVHIYAINVYNTGRNLNFGTFMNSKTVPNFILNYNVFMLYYNKNTLDIQLCL